MVVETSPVTSTSYKIKDLLLRAWRERWSVIEWGRNIKLLLRGVSGDVFDLADCILRQAINGPVINNLLMLYLNHCIHSQIISFGACVLAISKFSDLRPKCIESLLDFLHRYKNQTNCFGTDDDCLLLCRSLVVFVHWLHKVIFDSINEINSLLSSSGNTSMGGANNAQLTNSIHLEIIEKAAGMLSFITESSYLKSLLYIGKLEDPHKWSQTVQLHRELLTKIFPNYPGDLNKSLEIVRSFQNNIEWLSVSINGLDSGDDNFLSSTPTIAVAFQKMISDPNSQGYLGNYQPLIYHSIEAMISFYAILDPACPNELLANYLIVIGRVFDLTLSKLYWVILHTCLSGLIDTHALTLEDRKNINYHSWIAFLLFKIPNIFHLLAKHRIQLRNKISSSDSMMAEPQQSSNETKTSLEQALDTMLKYLPCIDEFLLRYKTEHLQKLFDSFKEQNLLKPAAVEHYMNFIKKRLDETTDQSSMSVALNGQNTSSLPGASSDALSSNILIFRAEQTVTSVLQPLYMDCHADSVAGIICRMQQSFDLILCAAATNGTLPKFAQKLVELNESNAMSTGENTRSSQIRAVTFDLSFVALCCLVQRYGTEMIMLNSSTKDSFFAKWCQVNLESSSSIGLAPDAILASYGESTKYDNLVQQLIVVNSQVEFKTSLIRWSEMCIAAQFAVAEILQAWIHNIISDDIVKVFVNRLKNRLCFLALSASCWLFSKIGTVSPAHEAKTVALLKELQAENKALMDGSTDTFSNETCDSNLAFGYKQRFLLMSSTIDRLFAKHMPHLKLLPPVIESNANQQSSQMFQLSPTPIQLSKTSLNVMLMSALEKARHRFSLKMIYEFDGLMSLGGAKWFVSQIVKYLFTFYDLSSLQETVDMAFGLFHLDLEQCALVLMREAIPKFLFFKSQQALLSEPRVDALMRLTVVTTFAAIAQLEKFKQLKLSNWCGQRRNYQKYRYGLGVSAEMKEQMLENTPFYYEMHQAQKTSNIDTPNDSLMEVDSLTPCPDNDSTQKFRATNDHSILDEPLYLEMLRLFDLILKHSFELEFSPNLLFPQALLQQIVVNLREDAPQVLRFVSFHLIEALIQSNHLTPPEHEQLLAYMPMETSSRARKIGARLVCQLQLIKTFVQKDP